MKKTELDRRNFHKFTAAAFGGALTGALAGCSSSDDSDADTAEDGGEEVVPEMNVCRGLNMCKGLGAGGENACSGQGTCATLPAHSCNGQNLCRAQGGCGQTQGDCAVPMKDDGAWQIARDRLAEKLALDGKEMGEAPPKAN